MNPEETEALSVSRMRPSPLSHRELQVHVTTRDNDDGNWSKKEQIQVTAEDLAKCAVTGDDVIAGKEVANILGYSRILGDVV